MSGDDDWPTPLPRFGETADDPDGDGAGQDASVFEVFAPPTEVRSPIEDEDPAPAVAPPSAPPATAPNAAESALPPAPPSLPTGPTPSSSPPRKRMGLLAWIGALAGATWLIAMPFMSGVTELRQNTQLIVLVLAVLGVNIATGYGGMISLGHGVFVALGSFAAAYAVDDLSLPWLAALVAGVVVAGLAGALIGLPALRIRGIHLALVTLGLAIAFQPLAKRFPAFTGGVSGRAVDAELTPPTWFGTSRWADGVYRYLICLLVVGVALWLTHNLINSRPGRAMRALRDNDTAAAVHGVNLVATRVATFAVSASLAGLGGALSIILVPFTSQESFPFQESLVLYATAVLGGLGSLWGSVIGVAIREIFSRLGELVAGISGLGPISDFFDLLSEENFVFGVVLVALTFVFPRGLIGIFRRRRDSASGEHSAVKSNGR